MTAIVVAPLSKIKFKHNYFASIFVLFLVNDFMASLIIKGILILKEGLFLKL